jgi:hypothetical protein
MGLERNAISGLSGGSPGGGPNRESWQEFCRGQIISLNIPEHVEGADWPDRPLGITRAPSCVRASARETTASWGES